jgi:hypothetical protein
MGQDCRTFGPAAFAAISPAELLVVLPVAGQTEAKARAEDQEVFLWRAEQARELARRNAASTVPATKDKNMFNHHKVEIEWAGRPLILETGKIARQADGAVSPPTARPSFSPPSSSAKEPKPGQDFFPLTVNYQEKTFAAGKIPGGYFKREGRPSEKETLVSRLIDRPIRPLFAEGYKNDTQVVVTVLSARPRERSRHPVDGRHVGCADAFRRAVHGPDRRRARRLHQRRIRAQPA